MDLPPSEQMKASPQPQDTSSHKNKRRDAPLDLSDRVEGWKRLIVPRMLQALYLLVRTVPVRVARLADQMQN